jgi:hypothetical protein
MSAIIALLITLGVIFAPEEATQDLIDQYKDHSSIVNTDIMEM